MPARLLVTQYSNSAFHDAALNHTHIALELERLLANVEWVHGVEKAEVATHGVYLSHEMSTHASPAASYAGNEVAALRQAFGDELLSKLLILNTKGFTGHPMWVSFEDVATVEVLMRQVVPPVLNYRERVSIRSEPSEKLSSGDGERTLIFTVYLAKILLIL